MYLGNGLQAVKQEHITVIVIVSIMIASLLACLLSNSLGSECAIILYVSYCIHLLLQMWYIFWQADACHLLYLLVPEMAYVLQAHHDGEEAYDM